MKKESKEFQNDTRGNSLMFFCGGDPELQKHLGCRFRHCKFYLDRNKLLG